MPTEPDFTEEEIKHRRDAAILRALNTPPKPRPTKGNATSPDAAAAKRGKRAQAAEGS